MTCNRSKVNNFEGKDCINNKCTLQGPNWPNSTVVDQIDCKPKLWRTKIYFGLFLLKSAKGRNSSTRDVYIENPRYTQRNITKYNVVIYLLPIYPTPPLTCESHSLTPWMVLHFLVWAHQFIGNKLAPKKYSFVSY
jgi:hypothetical protein